MSSLAYGFLWKTLSGEGTAEASDEEEAPADE